VNPVFTKDVLLNDMIVDVSEAGNLKLAFYSSWPSGVPHEEWRCVLTPRQALGLIGVIAVRLVPMAVTRFRRTADAARKQMHEVSP
jgi:hypothetical protein